MKITLFTLVAVLSAVPAAPMNSYFLETVGERLFNPIQGEMLASESDNTRTRRSVEHMDMCSYRMKNITKLARVAGEIFMSVDDSSLYRRARNHVSYVNLEQPGIYRAKIENFHY